MSNVLGGGLTINQIQIMKELIFVYRRKPSLTLRENGIVECKMKG
jgi:hypothetical protein